MICEVYVLYECIVSVEKYTVTSCEALKDSHCIYEKIYIEF